MVAALLHHIRLSPHQLEVGEASAHVAAVAAEAEALHLLQVVDRKGSPFHGLAPFSLSGCMQAATTQRCLHGAIAMYIHYTARRT